MCLQHAWAFCRILSRNLGNFFSIISAFLKQTWFVSNMPFRSLRPQSSSISQNFVIFPVTKPRWLGVGGLSKRHDKKTWIYIWGYIVYLPIYLSIDLSINLSIDLSMSLSTAASIYEYIYCIYRSIYTNLSINLSVCLSICLSRKCHEKNTYCWFIDANTIDLKQWKYR